MEPVGLPTACLPIEIDKLLGRGGTVLTGNQRAARTLRLGFDRQRRTDGLTSWQPPAIFAWDTWLSSLWRQLLLEGNTASGSGRLLLNRTQELHLWRSIISSDAQWRSLQSIDSLATMAADAWQLLCRYRGQSRLNGLGVSGDTRAFQRWAKAFTRRCESDLYLSASELEFAITSALSAKHFKPFTTELLLVGFDSIAPAQQALLDAAQEAGVTITRQPASLTAPKLHVVTAHDLSDELTQASAWLRETLESNVETRIAVIHPDIASERAELDRVFRQALAPELQDITVSLAAGPYEFSLGHPLSRRSMVAIALKLLRWITAALSIEDISHLLLSPYFASRTVERHHRAEFDAFELRHARLLRPELDLPSFIKVVERSHRAAQLSGLLQQLSSLHRIASVLLTDNKQKSFADWADNIRELLHSTGWATAASDDSIEFQTRSKWERALDELATLDFEGTRSTFIKAIDHLEQIAQRTLFAPESREAPIQIMSPQEAAGSRFDAIYFLRASDLAWPVRPGLNPLLGWRIQRELQMPGSDAAQDAEDARRITARIAASASTVVFSYARETEDGHQRLSPAVATLPLTPLQAPESSEPSSVVALEEFEDSANIPLTNRRVEGGSNILKLQAACGFRAFAEKRLWSTAPEALAPGMDAAERGNIVHLALEYLWQELRTQVALRSLTAEQRTAVLSRAIDQSLRRFQAVTASNWDAAYLELQRERLHRLLSAWLDLELRRSPFEVKLREQEYVDAAIGPLLLSLRVDRVDSVFNESGDELGELVLDYKTGLAGPTDWHGERPEEPQLPLYAALREPGTVAGIAFASLRAGTEIGLSGLAAGEGILPKAIKSAFETLDDQIADWHRILTYLAQDFAEGDARVRPKSYPKTCEFCQQRILCRLDPASLEELNEDEETDA